jgi:hypothetical protein
MRRQSPTKPSPERLLEWKVLGLVAPGPRTKGGQTGFLRILMTGSSVQSQCYSSQSESSRIRPRSAGPTKKRRQAYEEALETYRPLAEENPAAIGHMSQPQKPHLSQPIALSKDEIRQLADDVKPEYEQRELYRIQHIH